MSDITRWNAMQVEKLCDWAKVVANNCVTALSDRLEDRAFNVNQEELDMVIAFLTDNRCQIEHVFRTTMIKEGVQLIL